MPTSGKLIKKYCYVVACLKKENLLFANYPHFNPPLKEAKNVAIVFSIYFRNNMLKNDT